MIRTLTYGQKVTFEFPSVYLRQRIDEDSPPAHGAITEVHFTIAEKTRTGYNTPILQINDTENSSNFGDDGSSLLYAYILEEDYGTGNLFEDLVLKKTYTYHFGILIAGVVNPVEVFPSFWNLQANDNRIMWYPEAIPNPA